MQNELSAFHDCMLAPESNSDFADCGNSRTQQFCIIFLFLDLFQSGFSKLIQINTLVFREFEFINKTRECFCLWYQHNVKATKTRLPIGANLVTVIKIEDEPCVYKKVSGSTVVFLALYVDDILMIKMIPDRSLVMCFV